MTTPTKMERLTTARHKLAQLVLIDPVYAPIFHRVEREIAAHETTNDLISRARAVVEGYKAAG